MKELNDKIKEKLRGVPISPQIYENIENLLDNREYEKFLIQTNEIYEDFFESYIKARGIHKRGYGVYLRRLSNISCSVLHYSFDSLGGKDE